ncbi:MAG: hypothetical protein ACI4PC_07610 [Oscillospiraceae bacterium]
MKKVLALVLAMLLVVSMFAACGDTTTSSNPSNSGTTNNTTNNEPANSGSSEPAGTGTEEPPVEESSAMPTKADFAAGPEWDGASEPTQDNGNWAQSYAVINKLAEMAAEYDNVAPEVTYTLACHDPANSAPGEFLTAWANAVTIATEGAIDFNIGYSGAHSPTMQVVDDMVNGVIDFGWTLPCYFKGYFPLTNVIQNPALGINDATVGSNVMWDLYKNNEALQAEYDEGHVLFLWTNCTSPLSYKGSKEINSVAEISGNIRANNGPAQLFVEEAGATVMGCPIGDVYNNVSTGIFAYLVTDWHGIKSFALSDPGVLNYYVDTNVGCSAYALLVNNDVWDYISDEHKAAIESVSGDYLLNLVDIWNYWEAAGRYSAIENGGDIYEPSAEFAAELDAVYQAVAERWISEQADTAVAQDIYDQALALVEQYSK